MLVGRGQVHHFERAQDLSGAIVRFGDELLYDEVAGPGQSPGRLLTGRQIPVIRVPSDSTARVDALIHALDAEAKGPVDARSVGVQRHLLLALLGWAERWSQEGAPRQTAEDESDIRLHRRFVDLLERGFADHHDVGHYAQGLGVSPGVLWRALSRVTDNSTRGLITERVMLEAARLLRFTEMSVSEIASRVGFNDRLYFSRAFKRQYGESPLAYRERLHGRDGAEPYADH